MSSDGLTYALLNGEPSKKIKYFKDYYKEKWLSEISKTCKAKTKDGMCRLIEDECNYEDCFRRSCNSVNY